MNVFFSDRPEKPGLFFMQYAPSDGWNGANHLPLKALSCLGGLRGTNPFPPLMPPMGEAIASRCSLKPGLFFFIILTFDCIRFIMVYYERIMRLKMADTRGESDETDGSGRQFSGQPGLLRY